MITKTTPTKKIVFSSIIILILLFCCGFFLYSNTHKSQEIIFTEQKHDRNTVPKRLFPVFTVQMKYANYQIENKETTSADAEQAVTLIEDTFTRLEDYIGKQSNCIPTIIIVESGLAESELSEQYYVDNTLITSMLFIENGEYIALLLRACFGVNEPYLAYGIAGILTNKVVDTTTLVSQIDSTIQDNLLNLSGTAFYSSVNGVEFVTIEKDISYSLLSYIKDTYGEMELIKLADHKQSFDLETVKQDWLISIGSNTIYQNKHENFYDSADFTTSDDCDIIIDFPDITYYITWNPVNAIDITSRETLEDFLLFSRSRMNALASFMKEHVINQDKLNLNSHFNCFVEDGSTYFTGRALVTDSENMYLPSAPFYSFTHELVHIYCGQTTLINSPKWILEGLAEYITGFVYPDGFHMDGYLTYEDCDIRYARLLYIQENYIALSKSTDENDILQVTILNYYLSHGGMLDLKEQFDPQLYYDASSYAHFLKHGVTNNEYNIRILENGQGLEGIEGLYTYDLYTSFFNYLVNQYSLQEVMDCVTDYSSFESILGDTFNNLQDQWIASLMA